MFVLIGLAIVVVIAIVWYLATHHTPGPAGPAAVDLSNVVTASVSEAWSALRRDIPEIVSGEVAQLKAALAKSQAETAAAQAATQQVQATLDATVQQHAAEKASIAERVSAVITASPEIAPAERSKVA